MALETCSFVEGSKLLWKLFPFCILLGVLPLNAKKKKKETKNLGKVHLLAQRRPPGVFQGSHPFGNDLLRSLGTASTGGGRVKLRLGPFAQESHWGIKVFVCVKEKKRFGRFCLL